MKETVGKSVFASIYPGQKIDKADYDSELPGLMQRLGELQRQAKSSGVPTVITFDGWSASGIGVIMNRLLMALDPHGFQVHPMQEVSGDDTRPFYYRFWTRSPSKGDISVFSSSWYGRILDDMAENGDKKLFTRRLGEAATFEKALTDSGCLVIKLFLHISREEQRSRQNKLEKDPVRSFLLTKSDKEQNKNYGKFLKTIEAMVEKTDTPNAPWIIVEADSKRFATVKVIKTVIEALEGRLSAPQTACTPIKLSGPIARTLQGVDLSATFPDVEYKAKLDELQDKLRSLQFMAYHESVPVAIVFEGWDAAGKSGGIKRITEPIDPRGYQVYPTAAPNDVEISHHYLWRFWRNVPSRGRVAIFDRSWYGRVLVERVECITPPADWKRAYGEINEMEKEWAENGTILVKFWLHISRDEQLKRFVDREFNPFKSYKITDEDWRNREKWNRYVSAVNEMFERTSTAYAPWTIVPSNDKRYSRIMVLETVVDTMERRLGKP